ncbi:type I restriction-modification system endonuclease [Colwellia sp. 4_MG-2023]|uniref:type I restriction-modification system endonuclease n=1 Tax=unclassified Colwellia TaxID=196834 RepID=UPI0026E1A41A|nr:MULTISPECIES: type I restriction-modification system endonuclease [unclassified Colwellia]MDO6505552.1 type I restriction-modification system endonuclease [Colwellia sp. 5_MG-2023]MDO6554152.1 type I restriction-modification system endonuclease [Colwellia sp. 4_MG-2023]
MPSFTSNFEFLKHHDELLFRLAETAEHCYASDPNTSLIKMRQLGEALAQNIASRVGVDFGKNVKQIDLLNNLEYTLKLAENVKDAFHTIRKLGNIANHEYLSSSHRDALKCMQVGCALSGWYHITFGGNKAKGFKFKPFIKPVDPSQYVRELEEKFNSLKIESQRSSDRLAAVEQLNQVSEQKAIAEKQRADKMSEEKAVWESVAEEHENKLTEYRAKMDAANVMYFQTFAQQDNQAKAQEISRVEQSNFHLDEDATRIIIDEQLNEAGWEADTTNLRYSIGTRPELNKNKAIAEWPTESGPADYVLFIGLTPVATVEAKRSRKNVYSAIDQAKRYANGLKPQGSFEIEETWNDFKVPLTFATNGRHYLKQLEQESGIWFLDVRDNSNRRRALKGWYSPSEIKKYLKQTPQQADKKLDDMNFAYDLKLRDYQIDAIQAIEKTIKQGESKALVAMATGTGKTKTCIALVYRLLKSERFRRILFLVDRSALGIQATDDFTEVRMENLQTFADTFDIMGMQINKPVGKKPEDETKVHITTVQGLVQKILYPNDNDNKPGVGQYDCIVVDECHRGYLLDRELSDTELEFRNQEDYQSKYRAVIEYFDAFKIGLTATPALHTSAIFGEPVYSYTYTDAVIDGHLIDHLPPIRIHTKLAEKGIHYEVNDEVQVYDAQNSKLETYKTPDELDFDVAQFNRKVISPNFTEEVTKWLIESDAIDPYSPAKTLVFCVTDKHADQVVEAFKKACEKYHGEIDDDAIQKITGASDKPLEKIKRYKNDRLPNIAVTVDLLTTGVDIPAICNLVFLRRVNSRILYEQMLGRATRRCDDIGKETFRIYDAVDIYKQLEHVNSMKPVVTKVDITFSELEQELKQSESTELQQLAKNQFLAKLQSKKRHLTDMQTSNFERIVGNTPQEFAEDLKAMKPEQVAQWFTNHPGLGELLDMKVGGSGGGTSPIFLSDHQDEVTDISHGYGDNQKPEDYLQSFTDFINANSNRLVAIQTVIQRPWELTRQSLKELAYELEKNKFREQALHTAWNEVKNEEIAARIIGFIRQAAIGEALIPFETRVDNALEKILLRQQWKTPQKQWLQAIAKQMKATTIVDDVALDSGIFKQQLGGIKRANKLFEKPITEVLLDFNRELWA